MTTPRWLLAVAVVLPLLACGLRALPPAALRMCRVPVGPRPTGEVSYEL
jgi:hypothetical protein